MAFEELAYPDDIPWRRLVTNVPSLDAGSASRWQSSTSVFYYEPDDLPQAYCDRIVTYLKISVTLTNYQLSDSDVSVLGKLRGNVDGYAWDSFLSSVTKSYPCYGALLDVSVLPTDRDASSPEGPYISAAEPQKRELYEVMTQSGEVVSQTANKINILKGGTTTGTTENFDVDTGGGGGSLAFGLVSWSNGNKQEGAVQRDQRQLQDVTTTDTSRDRRESSSYTTNINNLYTLLQSFHLGGNRAVFFLQPRPHVQDERFTFIRGLRRLEGVQEFFLVVNRPKSTEGICVDIVLETAHLWTQQALSPRLIPKSQLVAPGNLAKTALARGVTYPNFHVWQEIAATWNSKTPYLRQLVARNEARQATQWLPEVQAAIQAGDITEAEYGLMVNVLKALPNIGIEDVAVIFEAYEWDEGQMFVQGRSLGVCLSPVESERSTHDDDVAEGERQPASAEERRDEPTVERFYEPSELRASAGISFWADYPGFAPRPVDAQKRLLGAEVYDVDAENAPSARNGVIQDVCNLLIGSSALPRTDPPVSLLETDFGLEHLARLARELQARGAPDLTIADLEEVHSEATEATAISTLTISALCRMRPMEFARRIDAPEAQARALLRDAFVAAIGSSNLTELDGPNHSFEGLATRTPSALTTEELIALYQSAGASWDVPDHRVEAHIDSEDAT